ncbi:PREDICTED: putative aluminum-activated malate transporter 3 [Brassica oleracea var. oleracea]|uniref:putative aluminum-activated malate transporter 3 n=1 Tax=Brassica oleracea var. oleracea TaxID=109376 RepID=UPI0006A6E3AA|nr:PREDICTED: putative aluminum-activated malate transporter 3 [Brassica oleracea var. oleracea]
MAAPDLESFRRSSMFDGSFRQSLRDGLLPQQTSDYSYMFEDRTHARCCSYRYFSDKITGFVKKSKDFLVTAWEMGTTDPRKIIFSAKMGLALTLVNLLIFFKLPGSELSNHYLWAILTIVVIFEFSIGGTFRKGCNTGLGTLSAGALALGMAEISDMTGNWAEVFNTASIVVVAFLGTYAKLYPTMKPYEYGFRAFLLTYCYVIVSGYRTGEFVETAVSRILMIALGDDLHNLIATNFVNVATSLEGCVNAYLNFVAYDTMPSMILVYESVKHMVMALHGCILSEIQVHSQHLKQLGIYESHPWDKEKWRDLNPIEDILHEIHKAAEELQSKIDDKWYLLVNDDNWEIGNPFRDATDELEKSDLYEEDLRQISIEDMWLAPEGEEESRMYKSASDLSLATYDELCVVAHFEEAIG